VLRQVWCPRCRYGETAVTAVEALRAEALFVSHLQPSDHPEPNLVRDVVLATVFRVGQDGCEACVAQECGDHPEAAVRRMRWCREQVAVAFEFELVRV